MILTRFDRRDAGRAEATAARRWGATTITTVVLSRSITAPDAAAIKVVVVVEAQEGATVDETVILHPETVVAIPPRPQTGCHPPLERRVLVAVCRHHHRPLISAMAVDPVDTGAGTTRAMAMEADMVRRQRSTTEAVVEEVIKAIKARGTNNHRTLVVMTVDKEVMEGIEATTVVTVAMVVAIAARSG